jgi:hypothetical protein
MAGTEGQSQYSVAFAALCLTVLLFIGSIVNTLLYNLYRHPLAHFPGPKLAGATYLYQTYFSLIGGSKYYIEIAKMHEKYGTLKLLALH